MIAVAYSNGAYRGSGELEEDGCAKRFLHRLTLRGLQRDYTPSRDLRISLMGGRRS